jgi:hypothetical protein
MELSAFRIVTWIVLGSVIGIVIVFAAVVQPEQREPLNFRTDRECQMQFSSNAEVARRCTMEVV